MHRTWWWSSPAPAEPSPDPRDTPPLPSCPWWRPAPDSAHWKWKRKPSLVASLLLHSQSHIQWMVEFSFLKVVQAIYLGIGCFWFHLFKISLHYNHIQLIQCADQKIIRIVICRRPSNHFTRPELNVWMAGLLGLSFYPAAFAYTACHWVGTPFWGHLIWGHGRLLIYKMDIEMFEDVEMFEAKCFIQYKYSNFQSYLPIMYTWKDLMIHSHEWTTTST